MKKNNLLFGSTNELVHSFKNQFPAVTALAVASPNSLSFQESLSHYLAQHPHGTSPAGQHLKRLLENEGQHVTDLANGQTLHLCTVDLLYQALTNGPGEKPGADFLLELYHQFLLLENGPHPHPSAELQTRWSKRWPSGMDKRIASIRASNKIRILKTLIDVIEHRHSPHAEYRFAEESSYEDKYRQVLSWWNDHRFHLAMAARTPRAIDRYLGYTLSRETLLVLREARQKGIPFFVTPYYLSLLDTTGLLYDDAVLRSYIFYSPELVKHFGQLRAWEKEDQVTAGRPNAAGWLLPNGHNIHRRYPDAAILIPDTMGRACGGLCASCQRMFDFQNHHFHFDLEELKPKQSWNERLKSLMAYFEEDTQLRDILLTGGDALMSRNSSLRQILDAIYKMAARKQQANRLRPDGEKFAELQRVRIGTRLPAYLPMRIDDELVNLLHDFKKKAQTVGIRQFIIQTHFETPLELTVEACRGISQLQTAGWTITNQLVFNSAASRRGHTAKLRQELNKKGVLCYYTFTVKGFEENSATYAPNCRSVQEAEEEGYRGTLSPTQIKELCEQFDGTATFTTLPYFLKKHSLPFAATDRHVLNLPGIGKSMDYEVIGVTADGRRIQRFQHDSTRKHSPLIYGMRHVHILENTSVGTYLRRLATMGEKVDKYASIWQYTQSTTTRRFPLFEYPDFPFTPTQEVTNFAGTEM